MIDYFLGSEDVGIYSVAAKIPESIFFVPWTISQSLVPNLSSEVNNVRVRTYLKLFRSMWVIGIAFIPSCLLILPLIIGSLYGSEYAQSSHTVGFLCLTLFGVCSACSTTMWLRLNGNISLEVLRTFSGLILNLAMNVLLIPTYGIKGAAISTSISYVLSPYLIPLLVGSPRVKGVMLIQLWPIQKIKLSTAKQLFHYNEFRQFSQ